MLRTRFCFSVVFVALIGLLSVGPSFAAKADLTSPERAVAAYVEAVARRDFSAIIAACAADDMSKQFDFGLYTDHLGALMAATPAPGNVPFFMEINKAKFVAEIATQIKFLSYGLMATGHEEILQAKTVKMDKAGAEAFANSIVANRLSGLALVKVGIPNSTLMNKEKYLASAAKTASKFGADAFTERLALITFEGRHFALGFSLLRYGDEWKVMTQSSPIAGNSSLGVPKPVTPETFEEMLR